MKIHRKYIVFSTKMTTARKIKIGKIGNLIFLSIQYSPHLLCKFDHFWKKKLFWHMTHAWKTLKRLVQNMPLTLTCFDANLFRPPILKKHPLPGCFLVEGSPFNFFWKKSSNFFSSNLYFSSYGHFCTQITPIFYEFSR